MPSTARGRVALVACAVVAAYLPAGPWVGLDLRSVAVLVLAVLAGTVVAASPRPRTRVLLAAWSVPLLATLAPFAAVSYLVWTEADQLATLLVGFGQVVLAAVVWLAFGTTVLVVVVRRRFGRVPAPVEE